MKYLVITLFLFISLEMNAQIMKNDIDSVSYALGISIANSLKQQGLEEINSQTFAKAVSDVFANSETEMTTEEANNFLQTYFQALAGKKGQATLKAGQDFLAENAKKEGVVTLESGLQYLVITEGHGATPTINDDVTTHYEGYLIDGTIFDSSIKRGQPATFGVSQVIKGWTEALQLMKEGSKWRLFIPSNLAYGERGAGSDIAPNSALIFDIELIKVIKK